VPAPGAPRYLLLPTRNRPHRLLHLLPSNGHSEMSTKLAEYSSVLALETHQNYCHVAGCGSLIIALKFTFAIKVPLQATPVIQPVNAYFVYLPVEGWATSRSTKGCHTSICSCFIC
jgi:hypothetical protein